MQTLRTKILLIDYDPNSIDRIRGLLEISGCEVLVSHDGLAGIQDFARISPALTLVQDLLPKKHGFEVCREIKRLVAGKYLPVILLTSARTGEMEIRRTGCDEYIAKPFADDTLLSTVRDLVPDVAQSLAPLQNVQEIEISLDTPADDAAVERDEPPKPAPVSIPVEFSETDVTGRLDSAMTFGSPNPVDVPARRQGRRDRSAGPPGSRKKNSARGKDKARKKTASADTAAG